ATTRLAPIPELASTQGGGIAALPDHKAGPVPEQAIYRVTLTATHQDQNPIPIALRGQVHITAERQSPATKIITNSIAIIRREAGF
ncbi:hypothetical protein, partial [Niveispirillum sp.]|uniref:hypothetical protein n=1 Tax=Niveispirillum sp. TaxID=1917217 RepID=UPI001B54AA44